MTRRLDAPEIARQLSDLPGWQRLGGALHARYQAPDFPAAAALVAAAAEIAEEMNHHPDVDLRWRLVRFELSTHSEGGITQFDVELAHRLAREAARLGATAQEPAPQRVELAIDAVDAQALLPFWRAGLGYVDAAQVNGAPQLRDPAGLGPSIWFQSMDPPRRERSRVHVDVYVPSALARDRVEAVRNAGGRLVTDEHAPSWWVLADAEGNELCVCTDD